MNPRIILSSFYNCWKNVELSIKKWDIIYVYEHFFPNFEGKTFYFKMQDQISKPSLVSIIWLIIHLFSPRPLQIYIRSIIFICIIQSSCCNKTYIFVPRNAFCNSYMFACTKGMEQDNNANIHFKYYSLNILLIMPINFQQLDMFFIMFLFFSLLCRFFLRMVIWGKRVFSI